MSTATAVDDPPAVSYRLGAGGRSGAWLGLGAGQLAAAGTGLAVAVLTLTAGLPVPLAAVALLAAGGVAAARVGGRALLDWTVPLARAAAASVAGGSRWRAPIPSLPPGLPAPHRLALPAEFGRHRVEGCPDSPWLGLLTDRAARTVTVVFDVAGVDRFPLLDPADRDALLAGWGDALAVLADTDRTLGRLQLLHRAYPAVPDPDQAYPGGPAAGEGELAGVIAAFAARHDSRLAAQWTLPRLDTVSLAAVAARAQAVSAALLPARLLTRPLDSAGLRRELAAGLHAAAPSPDALAGTVGPLSRRAEWTQVRTDDTWHRSYAVWPQTPVAAGWLSPLLLAVPAAATRTIAIHLQPLHPAAAARIARTRRATAALDQRDRARLGITSSAALAAAETSGAAMDAELAAGYRTHRLTALLTASAASLPALDDACQLLRHAAASCRLELRPLHGQHHLALAATLPLCRVRGGGPA
jgi:hypothetical protein